MEWYKFYGGEYLSDPKMLMLTASERSCWVTLLSFASVAEDGGRVKYLSEQQLMTAANISPIHEDWDRTTGVLGKFVKLDMIKLDSNGDITVKNWAKRQESYLTNAERQRRYRDKLKSNAGVTTPLQQSNARIEENRKDIDLQANLSLQEEYSIEPDTEDEGTYKKRILHPETERVEKYFLEACKREMGQSSLPSVDGRAMIKRAMKRITEEQCREKIDGWFLKDLPDQRLMSVRACFSDNEINGFLV